jgi:transposase
MFTLGSSLNFHLYSQPTDMRKSFDALSGIVQQELGTSPTNGNVYVFINKTRNKVKLLHWSGNSFVLYYKRLEEGTFEHPKYDIETGSYLLSYAQMVMLIDGISIKNLNKKQGFLLAIKQD